MKRIVKILVLFTVLFATGVVYADTSKCTPELRNSNSDAANKITGSYEFLYEGDKVIGFDIKVYNVPSNMNILYKVYPDNFNILGSLKLNNGNGSIRDNNLTDIYTYQLDIYANDDGCNYKVKSIKVTKPKRNDYSESSYCSYKETESLNYCKEWITSELDKDEKEIDKFLGGLLNKKTTTAGEEKCVDCGTEGVVFNFKNFIVKYKYTIIIGFVLAIILNIFVIIMLIKSGRVGDL